MTTLPPPNFVTAESAWVAPVHAGAASAINSHIIELDDATYRNWLTHLYGASSLPRALQNSTTDWLPVAEIGGWVAPHPMIDQASMLPAYSGIPGLPTPMISGGNGVDARFEIIGCWPSLDAGHISVPEEDQSLFTQVLPSASNNEDHPMKAEMDEIAMLQADWDGPGSIAPTIDAVLEARNFLGSLSLKPDPRLPDISAGQDGEVNISWRDDKIYVDLSFYRAGGASMYARVDGEVFKLRTGIFSINDLPDGVLARLFVS